MPTPQALRDACDKSLPYIDTQNNQCSPESEQAKKDVVNQDVLGI
jgi:hypothetical protein